MDPQQTLKELLGERLYYEEEVQKAFNLLLWILRGGALPVIKQHQIRKLETKFAKLVDLCAPDQSLPD